MSVPIGPMVPRRGNAFSRWFGGMFLRLLGWRVAGTIPDLPKMVMIGAPHTSNMDGVVAIAVLTHLGIRAGTMIKHSAFKGVMGPLLRWFGAIPINRRSPKGVVGQSVEAFAQSPALILLIAPEGTRSSTEEWKRGFYHIAAGAQAPILPAAVNYRTRTATFGAPVPVTGNYAADMRQLLAFYREHGWPRHPEATSKPVCEVLGLPWRPQPDED